MTQNKRFEIFWTATAIKQRDYIFQYWNRRNKSAFYSQKLNRKIKDRINLLKTYPEIGKLTDFNGYRNISLGHYSILYKQKGTRVFIAGIWDNRQDINKLILFLKNK